jgi:hypothetical protein
MNAGELMRWWKEDLSSKDRGFKRMTPKGAVAGELTRAGGDIELARAYFLRQERRLSARYPAFWLEINQLFDHLRAQAENDAVIAVANELEAEEKLCPHGEPTCANAEGDRAAGDGSVCGNCAADNYADAIDGAEYAMGDR